MEMTYQEYLAVTQRPNAATEQFVEYVNREKRITAVLADHVHFSFESALRTAVFVSVVWFSFLTAALQAENCISTAFLRFPLI